jgi:uncharacterized membrane protein YgcG
MAENADQKMLRTGLAGSIVVALCCFTPILVLIVAGAGLSAVTGYLDYALFPMLFALLGVLAQALWLRAGRPGRSPKGGRSVGPGHRIGVCACRSAFGGGSSGGGGLLALAGTAGRTRGLRRGQICLSI